MARLLFGGDDVSVRGPYGSAQLNASGRTGIVYSDSAGTVLADIITYPGGAAIAGSVITVTADSQLPLFQGPADGSDTLYVSVDGGTRTPIYTNTDARLDLLAASAAGKLVAGSTATYANLAALPAASAHTNEIVKTVDGGVYESTGSAWVQLVPPSGTFAPALPTVGSFTYDTNGNPLTDPDGNTYTWNADGTVATQTKGGVTRTFTYTSGNLTGVA